MCIGCHKFEKPFLKKINKNVHLNLIGSFTTVMFQYSFRDNSRSTTIISDPNVHYLKSNLKSDM